MLHGFRKTVNKVRKLSVPLALLFVLTGCGKSGSTTENEPATETQMIAETQAATEEQTVNETQTATETKTVTETATQEEVYVHGDDGYYCILDNFEMELEAQKDGTCWTYAASCSMETEYFKRTGKYIDIDPYRLVDLIYNDEDEGFIFRDKSKKYTFGGAQEFVTVILSNGFDGLTLIDSTQVSGKDMEAVKEYIRNRGGLAACVPDGRSYRRNFHGYLTINQPTANDSFYDHDVTIIGWDDHFPKEYFEEKAMQDGAWIAYNSMFAGCLYYISYDTELKQIYGHTVTDKYAEVLSHDVGITPVTIPDDVGLLIQSPSVFGSGVRVANVYHTKDHPASTKLGAVGTISLAMDQDVKIEIYDAELKKVLYTQDAHFDSFGYHTVELAEPLEVTDFAVAVTYGYDVPVEGTGWGDNDLTFKVHSEPGQSFIYLDGAWHDLNDPKTAGLAGVDHELNNAVIKALMLK